MKLSDLVSGDDVLEQARQSTEFRQLWDGQEFAREIALKVVAYRSDHDLTQAEFAKLIGINQPAVSVLEAGEDEPTLKTLARISAATGLDFHLDIMRGKIHATAAA